MKIIIFGAAGQVGTDCVRALQATDHQLIALTRKQADFCEPQQVYQCVVELKPDFVINACAYTAVDKAEDEPERANRVNCESVEQLAKACRQYNIPLLHMSTDYVFAGDATLPYREQDPVHAQGVYGRSKLAGEQAVQTLLERFIILRTSWVFGEHGNNFVKTMLRVGANCEQLKVVDDQLGRPSYVGHIVSAILFFVNRFATLKALPWGIYHCSSEGQVTWHGFAEAIFDMAMERNVLEKRPEVIAIPTSEYPTATPRPAYSVLSTDKLTALMGRPMPHWREGLARFLTLTKA
ncbi:MAG: dTDP-4-dehydrorhamnose reductase [Pseudomonadota bacterium]